MYTERDALLVMINTGPVYLDSEGCMVESGEHIAALYESYAADNECAGPTAGRQSRSAYAHAAEQLAEELWTRDVEAIQTELEY